MSKKIGLLIGGRKFDVDLENEFADFLQTQMSKDFNTDGNNDIKTLLQAYVRKNHELYLQDKKIEELIEKMEK